MNPSSPFLPLSNSLHQLITKCDTKRYPWQTQNVKHWTDSIRRNNVCSSVSVDFTGGLDSFPDSGMPQDRGIYTCLPRRIEWKTIFESMRVKTADRILIFTHSSPGWRQSQLMCCCCQRLQKSVQANAEGSRLNVHC